MKWNCLLLRLFWIGTEDIRTSFAQELRDLCQHRQAVEVDDSEIMEVFHDAMESDHYMTQASCDLQWAQLTRHAVFNEELADFGLNSEECQSTGLARQFNSLEQPKTTHRLDNLRAEVSLEQDETSLADRFS